MGKVSLYLIVIGMIFLVPAIILTIIPMIFPVFASNPTNIGYDWFSIVKTFVIGFFYVVAFAFIVLGLIIIKRDSE